MFVLGLTGGIGSGKSAASDYLARLGLTIIDADLASRIIVQPGQPALDAIAAHFGSHLLLEDGNLDRRALREIVFQEPARLKQLEAITHPAIEAEIRRQLAASTSAYTVLVSPLLLETRQHLLTHRILLIDAPEALQLARASQRDNASRDQIEAIINSQMARAEKQKLAHDILVNDTDLAQLEASLLKLHQHYLTLAKAHDTSC